MNSIVIVDTTLNFSPTTAAYLNNDSIGYHNNLFPDFFAFVRKYVKMYFIHPEQKKVLLLLFIKTLRKAMA